MTASEILLAILLLLALGALILVLLSYVALKSEVSTQAQERYETWRDKELQVIRQQYQEMAQKEATFQLQQYKEMAQKEALRQLQEYRGSAQKEATLQLQQWQERELQAIRQQYKEAAQKEATLQLQQWRQELEKGIRKDAVEKSRAVTIGKVTEHVVPFFPGFNHNPKDARFIGAPVDFVVFDGLDEGAIRSITFVEVKTNSSSLSTRERQIRNAIKQRLVEWEELRIAVVPSQNGITSDEVPPKMTVEEICPHCEKSNRAQARFCGHCGKPL